MKIEFMGPALDMGAGSYQPGAAPIDDMSVEDFSALASSIVIFMPHRPSEGINASLARAAGFWSLWGISQSTPEEEFGGNIELTRGGMVKAFLDLARVHPRYKFMVMIDNDESVSPLHPLQLCRWNEPFVTGVVCTPSERGMIKACFTKKDRYGNARFPSLGFTSKLPTKGLAEIESAGSGLVAIRKDALDAVVASGQIPFMIPEEIRKRTWETGVLAIGEDIAFCRQLAEVGMKRYVDFSVRAVHWKRVAIAWPEEMLDDDLDPSAWEVDPRDILHV